MAVALVAMLLVPSAARGERTRVDWQRGLFIGRGIAVGDLRSPSRQLARVKAERQAKAQCRKLLLSGIAGVKRAKGSGASAPFGEEALATLGHSIFSMQTDYGTDGSVVVEMALPLDALRALANGPDPLVSSPSDGPSALVVDARATGLKPALGYALIDGTTSYGGPTLFFTSEADARKHLGIGKKAPLVMAKPGSAKGRKAGTIALDAGTLATLVAAQPLVAILWKAGK